MQYYRELIPLLFLKKSLLQKIIMFAGVLFLIASFCSSLDAQTDSFRKLYGGTGNEKGFAIQQTNDSGYIAVGYSTRSSSEIIAKVYAVKTLSNGDTVWTRTYGGGSDDYGYDVRQTNDSGYCIAGYTSSFGSGGSDVYLVKTNSAGNQVWSKTYGGTSSEFGYAMEQTSDSGFVIVGQTYSYGVGGADIYLIKTNAFGDTLWTRTYGGASYDVAYSVQQTNEGGYILTGWTYSFGTAGDIYLVKTNSTGDTLWTKVYGGNDADWGNSVVQTADSGFIIAGWTSSYGAGSEDCYLIKTNSQGDTVWTKTFGGAAKDRAYAVRQTDDGGYITAGLTASYGNGQTDYYLIKTDANGNFLWSRTFGKIDFDEAYGMDLTSDGGFVTTGTSYTVVTPFSYDLSIVKTNSSGLVGIFERTIADIPQQYQLFQNYPNPFNPSTTIRYSVPVASSVRIKIYNMLGQEIISLVEGFQPAGEYEVPFNANGLSSGVYFYRMEAAAGYGERTFTSVRKFVLLK